MEYRPTDEFSDMMLSEMMTKLTMDEVKLLLSTDKTGNAILDGNADGLRRAIKRREGVK